MELPFLTTRAASDESPADAYLYNSYGSAPEWNTQQILSVSCEIFSVIILLERASLSSLLIGGDEKTHRKDDLYRPVNEINYFEDASFLPV